MRATLFRSFSLALLGLTGLLPLAWAQVTISDPWAKATTGSQSATAVYMTLKSDKPLTITAVQSPLAGVAEIHQMTMDANDRMTMRSMPSLELGAGQTLELKPGGLHLMLMDLRKTPLKPGDSVPLTLTLKSADGKTTQQSVSATVRPLTGGNANQHHHHSH